MTFSRILPSNVESGDAHIINVQETNEVGGDAKALLTFRETSCAFGGFGLGFWDAKRVTIKHHVILVLLCVLFVFYS